MLRSSRLPVLLAVALLACAERDGDELPAAGSASRTGAASPPATAASAIAQRAVPTPTGAPSVAPSGVLTVSILEVIARPESYDGHRVSIAGFLGDDETKLYLTREHAEHKLARYAIALNRADCQDHFRPYPVALDELKGHYVEVEAVLSTRMGGEFGQSPAGLCDIEKIEAVEAGN